MHELNMAVCVVLIITQTINPKINDPQKSMTDHNVHFED